MTLLLEVNNNKDIFNGFSFRYSTPDGTAYINISEFESGKIHDITFSIGKAGTNVNAWSYALAKMVVHALHNGAELNDVVNLLSNITSARVVRHSGHNIYSGPEALFLALVKYRQSIPKVHNSWRAPKINRRYGK